MAGYAMPVRDDPVLLSLIERVRPIVSRKKGDAKFTGPLSPLNSRKVMEEYIFSTAGKSFLLNNKHLYICVKNGEGEYYSTNQLTEVMLHELAHGISGHFEHDNEFYATYYALILRAVDMKLYDPKLKHNPDYCTDT